MQILVVGQGGREHAMAWKMAQSSFVKKVFVAPGNAGTATEKKVENIDIAADDIAALLAFALLKKIDLTVVGPELPLSLGIVDQFQQANLLCFGPNKMAAQLESSKVFCKNFLKKYHIPTANYATFTEDTTAIAYLNTQTFPLVIKADGLAGGKGVVIAKTLEEAKNTVIEFLNEQRFGKASAEIIIEDFLEGTELSYIVMCDGQHILPLASSQDYKRRDDNQQGPNTGGMGAISPAPILTKALEKKILKQIIEPTLEKMALDYTPYTGFLYAGIMVTLEGEPKLLEYNCRLGDPETQPLMLRLQSDFFKLCFAATQKTLHHMNIHWDTRVATTVVMTAQGYPLHPLIHFPVVGLNQSFGQDTKVFHGSTKCDQPYPIATGGRVLCVTSLGETQTISRNRAYAGVTLLDASHFYYRCDIGKLTESTLE